MKLYYNNTFKGYWAVGTSAIVWADSPEEAANILNYKLSADGPSQDERIKPEEMTEFKRKNGEVIILNDGDY